MLVFLQDQHKALMADELILGTSTGAQHLDCLSSGKFQGKNLFLDTFHHLKKLALTCCLILCLASFACR